MIEYIANSHKSLSVERFEAFKTGKDSQAVAHLALDCKLKDNAFLEKKGFEESQMIFLRAHDINFSLEILPK